MSRVYLITGPQNVGPIYFKRYYMPLIDSALTHCPPCRFVLGDANGVDQLAQAYLAEKGMPGTRVTIFIKHGKVVRIHNPAWSVDDSAETYPDRDIIMAREATHTIVCLPQFGGATTGALMPLLAVSANTRPDMWNHCQNCERIDFITEELRDSSEPFNSYLHGAERDFDKMATALRFVMSQEFGSGLVSLKET
jgi:hypothetical protein